MALARLRLCWGAPSTKDDSVISDVDDFLDMPLTAPHSKPAEAVFRWPCEGPRSGRDSLPAPCQRTNALPALHRGALEGDFEAVVCELLVRGADVNIAVCMVNANKEVMSGVTPLHLAAQSGNIDMCKLLLRRGSDPRLCAVVVHGGHTFTPADVALTQGHIKLWWLLNKAAKVYGAPEQQKQLVTAS